MIPACYSTSFSGTTIAKGWSDFHYYEFLHHPSFGLCLFLDGILQSTEFDQHIYHESLIRAALEGQQVPDDVLIVGGAGGGALHQLRCALGGLKCRVTIVDIDEKLFSISEKLMRKWRNGEFESPRLDVVFANGCDYLRETDRRFDVIILDVSDPLPNTKSNDLYSGPVLKNIVKVLRPGGVVVFHSAAEHTLDHVFVLEAVRGDSPLKRIAHCPIIIPSFEHSWVFNTLKKQI